MFDYSILMVIVLALSMLLGLPVWWIVSDYKTSQRNAEQAARRVADRKAEREERRRNFKRQVYPALGEDVPAPCGLGSPIPARMPLSASLASDTSALMSCEVILDGEQVYGPWSDWLEENTGMRIRTLTDLEKIALKYAHQEWLVKFVQPLHSMVYQRHGDGRWNLIKVGTGMF